jgi:hypothetical protein
MAAAFECFSPDCTALTPSGALDNENHEAAARTLKPPFRTAAWS